MGVYHLGSASSSSCSSVFSYALRFKVAKPPSRAPLAAISVNILPTGILPIAKSLKPYSSINLSTASGVTTPLTSRAALNKDGPGANTKSIPFPTAPNGILSKAALTS